MRVAIAIIGILAILMFLKWQFPYAVQSGDEQMHLLYMVTLLALVGSGFLLRNDLPAWQMIRAASIWLVIVMVLVLGYSYRDVLLNNRLAAELMPQRPQVSGNGDITVRTSEDGHFHIEMDVNGVPVKFMVDTGASDIVLSPRDAERVGFDTATLNYTRTAATANGYVKGAVVKLQSLSVAGLAMRDVVATVNGVAMDSSLLGMDFLKALHGYKVEGNTLTLVP